MYVSGLYVQYDYYVQYFRREITLDIRLTFSVGDTTHVGQLVLSKTKIELVTLISHPH